MRLDNGALWSEWWDHFCIGDCCQGGRSTLECFLDQLVDAYIPRACPKAERGKWVGVHKAVEWIGLLENSHGAFAAITVPMMRELSDSSKPVTSGDFDLAPAAAAARVAAAPGGGALVPGGLGAPQDPGSVLDELVGGVPLAADGSPDWTAWQHKVRTGASALAKLHPGPDLFVLRKAMRPHQRVVQRILHHASDVFDSENIIRVARGERAKLRVIEAARGAFTAEFWRELHSLLFDPSHWDGIRPDKRTTRLCLTAFKYISSGGCATKMLLDEALARDPVVLYKALDLDPEELAELVALKRCRLTRWATKFLEDYNTVEKLGGTEAQGCLLASAQGYLALESVKLEHGHSRLRRVVHTAVQTYKRPTDEVIQEMTLMHQRDSEQHVRIRQRRKAVIQKSLKRLRVSK